MRRGALAMACGLSACVTLWPARAGAQDPAPAHQHAPPAPAPAPAPARPSPPRDSAGEDAPGQPLPPFIPPLTDADRAAAFPDVMGHAMGDHAVRAFVLFDQLEGQTGGGTASLAWDTRGWIGGDRQRLWFRSEGDVAGGRLRQSETHAFYGRRLFRWWDVVAGVRHDARPGPARTWAAIGLQGLAPYWFDVEATAYVGAEGRTQLRLDTEYDLLLTNRLVLQPRVEVDAYGKADPARGVGAGLSSAEAGLRLRYEVRREFAPYVGVTWHRTFFGTADLSRAAGGATRDARLVVGARVWM